MARMLAIDWDAHEARYLVAAGRSGKLAVETAGALPMPAGAEGVGGRAALGDALRQALAGKAARATTIVAVDRSQIELASMSVPRASEAELPEMVWNQAMRSNSAIGEDAVLDFVPHGEASAESQAVTAAAIPRVRLEQVKEILDAAGVGPKAVTVRPYATGAMVLESLAERESTCLVVNVLAEEVDLMVLSGGEVVFWRTVRHANASTESGAARRLMAEIGRTRVVAQSHTGGKAIEAVCLCGGLDEHPALIEALQDGLPVEVTLVDPFADQEATQRPENPGRYASLVGMLLTESAGRSQAIDFLHPRQVPAPPDRRRTYVLAGAAAALVVLLSGYQAWSSFAEYDSQIETLESRLDDLDDQFKRAGQRQKVIAAIDSWSASDVNWLDELRDLSLRFPSGRDAMVLRMGMSQEAEGGGAIDMVGIVRDPVVVSNFENNLRDDHHHINSRHMQERVSENSYTWHFESSILVAPRESDEYVSHLPAQVAQESGEASAGEPPPRSAANNRR
ncbi:MAG: hypothetical protein DWQ37_14285 [Planctomycetota bacterium]|nr:MAG: hypothetical protein DWQ37_14285 [Planctomycetota bacterium]